MVLEIAPRNSPAALFTKNGVEVYTWEFVLGIAGPPGSSWGLPYGMFLLGGSRARWGVTAQQEALICTINCLRLLLSQFKNQTKICGKTKKLLLVFVTRSQVLPLIINSRILHPLLAMWVSAPITQNLSRKKLIPTHKSSRNLEGNNFTHAMDSTPVCCSYFSMGCCVS